MPFLRSKIVGVGSYLPPKVVSNDDLSQLVETSDAWIRERTGITQRHVAQQETTTEMGVKAAQKALKAAGLTASDVDALILSSFSCFHSPSPFGIPVRESVTGV